MRWGMLEWTVRLLGKFVHAYVINQAGKHSETVP